MENVPPPPKSQPPRIDELTSALEKQLSEIEKHVIEKRKQTAVAAAAAATIPSRPGSAAGGEREREQAQKSQQITAVTHRYAFIRFCLVAFGAGILKEDSCCPCSVCTTI